MFPINIRASIKLLIILIWLTCTKCDPDKILHRQRRYLYFPFGGTFKLVLGFAIPLELGLKQNMGVGWNFQFQYPLPPTTNDTRPYPPIVERRSREKRDNGEKSSDRALAYMGLEAILNRNGMKGRACLLRAICENAVTNTLNEENGLYGRLLHIFLTPDYGDGEIDPDLSPDYLDAKKAGKFGVDCASLYNECEQGHGLLDLISVLDH